MMKSPLFYVLIIAAVLTSCSVQNNEKSKEMNLENEYDKFSYSLGINVASNMFQNGIDSVNVDAFAQAMTDVMAGSLKITEQEAGQAIQEFLAKKQDVAGAKNAEEGAKFLEENKKREGVVELESGLQYEILKEGTGAKPAASSTVVTHYHGTLINGKVFDSSVERGEPASFPVNRVIPGWTEALQLMSVGSKWKLYVPSDLAYGPRGAGADIGPNTTLIFEVELLEIKED